MRNWEPEEIDYLERHWGKTPILTIMKKLDRSIDSVKCKANALNLGKYMDNADCWTVDQIMKEFHVSAHTVREKWGKEYGLKLTHKKMTGTQINNVVKTNDQIKWLEAHPELWDSRKLETYILGTEPQWLVKKRKADAAENRSIKKPWTCSEIALLRSMTECGMRIYRIAEHLGRTYNSVAYQQKILRKSKEEVTA